MGKNLPNRVTLELTNRCNRSCKGCPRHKMTYPLGNMDMSLLEHIVEQLPPTTVIVPFFRGESLLHPRFVDAMEKLRKFKTVQLATNGDCLTRQNRNAITSACSFVSLSLHSIDNPRVFLPSAKNEGVTTQVSILESRLPANKMDYVNAWLKHVDRFRVYREHSHNGFGDVPKDGGFDSSVGLPCIKPFEEMVVYWDGKVALCNHDWDTKHPLGDMNIETVKEVWGGYGYQTIRKLHNESRRDRVESCWDCDYWKVSYLKSKMFGELYTN